MSVLSVYRSARVKVHDVLEVGGAAHPAGHVVNAFIVVLIIANALAFAAETVDTVYRDYGRALDAFNAISVGIFTVEYVLRIWSSVEIPLLSRLPRWEGRLKFATRPIMLIDLAAILPWYFAAFFPIDLRLLRVLRLFRLLMLARYSPALQTLQRVLMREYHALVGALLVMLTLLLFAATIMYFLERNVQPDHFGSIPASAWWALETLTTVGYGDTVPLTPLGKVFGGMVMLFGLGMFALPIAILATGFSQEANRHEFVATWGMMAAVPLFSSMKPSEIVEITRLVYTRSYPAGASIVHAGDSGAAMYIIESGEAIAYLGARRRAILRQGDFFGEMALLEHRRHKHEVSAETLCRILVLDAEALAQLARRHPKIVQQIKRVARSREQQDAASARRPHAASRPRAAKRPRKPPGTPSSGGATSSEEIV